MSSRKSVFMDITPRSITSDCEADTSEREDERRDINQQSSSSLISIHKAAIKDLVEPDLDQMKARLNKLRRRRIALTAMINERESNRTLSVGHELHQLKQSISSKKGRPYLQRIPGRDRESRSTCSAKLLDRTIDEKQLAQRMNILRFRRKLAAAYRLSGISFLPCSEDIMALRFDVCVHGCFMNCFYAFFDIVCAFSEQATSHDEEKSSETSSQSSEASEDKLFLRLAQHTLPASIPLNSILQETLGGVAYLGNNQEIKTTLNKLRCCAQRLYRACYCYSLRQDNVRVLESLQKKDLALREGRRYVTDSIQPSDSCDRIMFQMKLLSGTCTLLIELLYKVADRALPTNVTAKNLTHSSSVPRRKQQRQNWPSISDSDESEDHNPTDELIEAAITAFRQHSIRKALKVMEESMLEW